MSSIVDPPSDSNKTPRRKGISPRLRFEILRRDNHTCRYCGGQPPEVKLTVDHVLPVTLGGTDDPSNLCAACKDCNAGKSSSTPDEATVAAVNEDAARWAAAMEEAARLAAERAQVIHEYVAAFDAEWHNWGFGSERTTPVPRPRNWEDSVRHWQAIGLPVVVLVDAVRIAMRNNDIDARDTWRYFCDVAWTSVRKMQAEAQAML